MSTEFDNTDEWYESIPAELRPDKAQCYHLLAENSDSYYTAYVSQQICSLMGKTDR